MNEDLDSIDQVFNRVASQYPFKIKSIPPLDNKEIDFLEKELGEEIPSEVRKIYNQYDMSHLNIADISFGYIGSSTYLQRNNLYDDGMNWWGTGMRPKGFLCFAISEAKVILLDCYDENIYCVDPEEGQLTKICENMSTFILAMANLIWNQGSLSRSYRKKINIDEGGPFWFMYGLKEV
jgi:hypothetical protein